MEDNYFEATRLAILDTLEEDVKAKRLTSGEAIEVLGNALADVIAARSGEAPAHLRHRPRLPAFPHVRERRVNRG